MATQSTRTGSLAGEVDASLTGLWGIRRPPDGGTHGSICLPVAAVAPAWAPSCGLSSSRLCHGGAVVLAAPRAKFREIAASRAVLREEFSPGSAHPGEVFGGVDSGGGGVIGGQHSNALTVPHRA